MFPAAFSQFINKLVSTPEVIIFFHMRPLEGLVAIMANTIDTAALASLSSTSLRQTKEGAREGSCWNHRRRLGQGQRKTDEAEERAQDRSRIDDVRDKLLTHAPGLGTVEHQLHELTQPS
ncbi:hypothetical protein LTR78_003371 [Recurvomyces mirabilis]|uniref:Uncharacterized protein n=1 Tax=Recurvomyces mirabilis TaxID=574656 RepID=A0AAE0WRP5_9PEZI|nr:hypothetical protein LTR78_003371 [Recurvomyces mirabilis]KAK5154593.1 hypothetical protein LTS14_006731 [Recurvomyces mirabilis]